MVHISSGVSGLVAALVLGRRQHYGSVAIVPHNVPMTVLGAGVLWFGWFGFNAGSALAANGLAVTAFATTNTAAATFGWMFTEWILHHRPTVLGAASGGGALYITCHNGRKLPRPVNTPAPHRIPQADVLFAWGGAVVAGVSYPASYSRLIFVPVSPHR